VNAYDLAVLEAASITRRRRLRMGGRYVVPESTWVPTDLGSKLILWLDFTDPTVMNTAADGTGSNPTNGDTVRRIEDKSSSGNDFSTTNSFATYNSAGYIDVIAGTSNKPSPISALSGVTSDMIVATVIDPAADTSFVLMAGPATVYVAVAEDGSTSTVMDENFGSGLQYFANGTEVVSPSRDTWHDALAGSWSYAEVHNADVSGAAAAAGPDPLRPFHYWSGTANFSGNAKHFILTTNNLTAGELTSLRSWMAAEAV